MSTTTKTKPTKRAPKAPAAPPLPTKITMKASELKRIIATVTPAASTDEFRPIFNCVRVRMDGDETLTFTCCDSYRIHNVVGVKPIMWRADIGAEALIPAAWLRRWATVRWNQLAEVNITWDGRRVILDTDGDTMSTFVHDGTWPKTDNLLANTEAKVGAGTQAFNPRLLAGVFAAAAKFAPDSPIRCYAFDSTSLKASSWQVVRTDTAGHETLTCLIMPVRVA